MYAIKNKLASHTIWILAFAILLALPGSGLASDFLCLKADGCWSLETSNGGLHSESKSSSSHHESFATITSADDHHHEGCGPCIDIPLFTGNQITKIHGKRRSNLFTPSTNHDTTPACSAKIRNSSVKEVIQFHQTFLTISIPTVIESTVLQV